MMLSIKKSDFFFYLFTSINAFYDGKNESFNVFFMVCWLFPLNLLCIMKGDNYVSFFTNNHCS
jgi:hypothetical protein